MFLRNVKKVHEGITDVKEMWKVMGTTNVKKLLRSEWEQGWEELEGRGGGRGRT